MKAKILLLCGALLFGSVLAGCSSKNKSVCSCSCPEVKTSGEKTATIKEMTVDEFMDYYSESDQPFNVKCYVKGIKADKISCTEEGYHNDRYTVFFSSSDGTKSACCTIIPQGLLELKNSGKMLYYISDYLDLKKAYESDALTKKCTTEGTLDLYISLVIVDYGSSIGIEWTGEVVACNAPEETL